MSENWRNRRDLSGSKFSDRLTTMSAFRSGRHQHGQLLQGRWVKVLMEVVTPQTGRGQDLERHIIGGNALHCEGHVEGQLQLFYHSKTEHRISNIIRATTDESAMNPTCHFLFKSWPVTVYRGGIKYSFRELKSSAQVVFRPQCHAHPRSGLLRKRLAVALAVWGVRREGDKPMETGSTEGRHRSQVPCPAAPWHLTTWEDLDWQDTAQPCGVSLQAAMLPAMDEILWQLTDNNC